jgi:hypothetical protein
MGGSTVTSNDGTANSSIDKTTDLDWEQGFLSHFSAEWDVGKTLCHPQTLVVAVFHNPLGYSVC